METNTCSNAGRPASEEVSLDDASKLSGLAHSTLHTQIRNGRLKARRNKQPDRQRRRWFIRRGDLHAYLMSRDLAFGSIPLPEGYVAPLTDQE